MSRIKTLNPEDFNYKKTIYEENAIHDVLKKNGGVGGGRNKELKTDAVLFSKHTFMSEASKIQMWILSRIEKGNGWIFIGIVEKNTVAAFFHSSLSVLPFPAIRACKALGVAKYRRDLTEFGDGGTAWAVPQIIDLFTQ